MNNHSQNFIFDLFNVGFIKKYIESKGGFFYDVRIKQALRKMLIVKNIKKYSFTKTIQNTISNIDITKKYPTELGYLYSKYGEDVGVCFCEWSNLAFIYSIGINNIKLIVTSGTKKSTTVMIDKFGRKDYAGLLKAIVGSCVISYDTDKINIIPCNILHLVFNKITDVNLYSNEDIKIIKQINNELQKDLVIQKLSVNDIINNETESHSTPILQNNLKDYKAKECLVTEAIKMFIYLKAYDKTPNYYISENSNNNNSISENKKEEYILVDSLWNNSINVINNFGVSGHYRNQPKKNKNKEWYKELIFIHPFIKNGYTRNYKACK